MWMSVGLVMAGKGLRFEKSMEEATGMLPLASAKGKG